MFDEIVAYHKARTAERCALCFKQLQEMMTDEVIQILHDDFWQPVCAACARSQAPMLMGFGAPLHSSLN